jgi:putative redox protein
MEFKRVTFENAAGEKLAGRIDFSQSGPPLAYALFAHCFTCTKNFKAIANISNALTQRGFAVMRFDFAGLGESEGDFADTNFSSNVSDLVDAASFMEGHFKSPKLLVGHSLGGTACLQAAIRIPSVSAIVTIGSPAEPRHVKQHLRHVQEQIDQKGEAEVLVAGRAVSIKQQFIDDIEKAEIKKVLPELNRPLLILHSPMDEVVSIENAGHLFQFAKHPKSFISLDSADHMISNPKDSEYAGYLIAAWADRYIRS